MRFIAIILFLFTTVSHGFYQKLIVTSDKNLTKVQNSLSLLNNNFQNKYHLDIEVERLGEFNILTIKPIESIKIKNEILFIISPLFSDIFAIDYIKNISYIDYIQDEDIDIDFDSEDIFEEIDEEVEIIEIVLEETNISVASKPLDKSPKVSMINQVGLEWLAILLLSFVGLFSSIHNRRKILTLKKKQENLVANQDRIEKDINNLGEYDV